MQLNPNTSNAYHLLHNGVLALARAERQGIRVDPKYVEEKKWQLTEEIEDMTKKFKASKFYKEWVASSKDGKVNMNSPRQLSAYLYDVKGITPPKLTETGFGSTDVETLQNIKLGALNELIEIRKKKKIKDTYLDAFAREQVNGYIHPFFNLHLVKTFRSSSSEPNFQNIPKRNKEAMEIVRNALHPRPGHQLLEVDFSGLEVRIAACYHKDQTMLKYINNPETDMHRDMAEQIFGIKFDGSNPNHQYLRAATKNGFVFPQFYGDYFKNCAEYLACKWGELPNGSWKAGKGVLVEAGLHLSDQLKSCGFHSLKKFESHIEQIEKDFWENRFHQYAGWKERWWKQYKECGYVDMYTGFRCSGVMGKNDAINYPIQGSAFHCLLWSFIRMDHIMQDEEWDTKLVGQIHDSIILDVHPDELDHVAKTVRRVTCEELPVTWPWIIVPLDIDAEICPVDASWAEKEEYEL